MDENIWYREAPILEYLNAMGKDTMAECLGMKLIEVGPDFLCAKMPVDKRTHQPYGLLHGGASAALAETLGSVASACCINPDKQLCVGIEINCNHVKGVSEGWVYGTVCPLHIGASTHVWEIKIRDEKQRLICVSRLTVSILKKRPE